MGKKLEKKGKVGEVLQAEEKPTSIYHERLLDFYQKLFLHYLKWCVFPPAFYQCGAPH